MGKSDLNKAIEKAVYEERFEDAELLQELLNYRSEFDKVKQMMLKKADDAIKHLEEKVNSDQEKQKRLFELWERWQFAMMGMLVMATLMNILGVLPKLLK